MKQRSSERRLLVLVVERRPPRSTINVRMASRWHLQFREAPCWACHSGLNLVNGRFTGCCHSCRPCSVLKERGHRLTSASSNEMIPATTMSPMRFCSRAISSPSERITRPLYRKNDSIRAWRSGAGLEVRLMRWLRVMQTKPSRRWSGSVAPTRTCVGEIM